MQGIKTILVHHKDRLEIEFNDLNHPVPSHPKIPFTTNWIIFRTASPCTPKYV